MNNRIIRVATNPDPNKTQTLEGVVSGILLLLATLAAAAMVWTRLQADIDQPTFEEVIAAIDENSLWYNYHGVVRVLFGGLLIAAASMIRPAMALVKGWQLTVSSILLNLGGIAMVVSGVLVIFVAAVYWSDVFDVEQFDEYRALAGKIGNTFIGVSLLLMTPVQWRLGGLMKISAVVAPVTGVTMSMVWWDASVIHQISGYAFLIWTLVTSISLIIGAFGVKPSDHTNVDFGGARKFDG